MMAMALRPRRPRLRHRPRPHHARPQADRGETFERAWRANPLQRGAAPQDIARAALFILQTPAITGTTLTIDGGEHLMHRMRDIAFLAAT